jgi:hypothetical protein
MRTRLTDSEGGREGRDWRKVALPCAKDERVGEARGGGKLMQSAEGKKEYVFWAGLQGAVNIHMIHVHPRHKAMARVDASSRPLEPWTGHEICVD